MFAEVAEAVAEIRQGGWWLWSMMRIARMKAT